MSLTNEQVILYNAARQYVSAVDNVGNVEREFCNLVETFVNLIRRRVGASNEQQYKALRKLWDV